MWQVIEMFMESDTDDFMWLYANEECANETLAICEKRESVPNVMNYMEVINNMQIPENVDDFRYHYRVSRDFFDVILGELFENLLRKGHGQHETVTPEKQLLVGLCYMANMQSMRELAHVFSLSKSTVHSTVLGVIDAIVCVLGNRVS